MNPINYISALLLALFAIACNPEPTRPEYDEDALGAHISFKLLVDDDGDLVLDENSTGDNYAQNYEIRSVATLKVPVAISTKGLSQEVTATYDIDDFGDDIKYNIAPNILSFSPDKLVDTLYITPTSRWTKTIMDSTVIALATTSDPNITIGYPYGVDDNDSLTLNYGDLVFPYTFEKSEIKLLSTPNQSYDFKILFTNGLLPDELSEIDILIDKGSNIDYELVQHAIEAGDVAINYTLEINDPLDKKIDYEILFELADIEGYVPFGLTSLKVTKETENNGNNSINMARHFYDVALDAYNRLYAFLYLDYSADGNCGWRETFMHVVPVEVAKDHPNAVWNEDDNKWYHAHRIGFDSPNEGRTTNSFGFKYWFVDEYTDADLSPGFNVNPSLEFYPDGDTSLTSGTVQVMEQTLTVALGENDTQVQFDIIGEGTYQYDEGSYELYRDSIFTIHLTLGGESVELWGGTHYGSYVMKNRDLDSSEKPEEAGEYCIVPINY